MSEHRSSHLEAELAARGQHDPRRSVRRAYSRGVTVTPGTLAPEQGASSAVHADLGDFVEDVKLEATPHDEMAFENGKKKLWDKHYKSHHIQKWKSDGFEHRWAKLGIEPGIGRRLADNVGAFGYRKKPAGTLTHIQASTVSTAKPASSRFHRG